MAVRAVVRGWTIRKIVFCVQCPDLRGLGKLSYWNRSFLAQQPGSPFCACAEWLLEPPMAKSNGQVLPILIAGGGIGGLAAAHALARKGFAVRVLEQAAEFREIGAGIQLGPNVFRALEWLGLKEAVLADAHRPPGMQMPCAPTAERVTRVPLDDPPFTDRLKQPHPVTHPHDLPSVFINEGNGNNLVSREANRTGEDFEEDGAGVTGHLQSGERVRGRAVVGCDGMWSKVRDKVAGDGKPLVSGHIAYRAVHARE